MKKFKFNLMDLQKLNFKTVYSWPLAPKLGFLFLLVLGTVLAGYFLYLTSKMEELEISEHKEVLLKEDFITNKKQAVNLTVYENQLNEIETTFGTLLKQLPNKSEMPALVNDINQAGLSRNLKFELFRPATQEKFQEFYAELPIDIKLTGSFNDVGNFASEVSALSRVVVLSDLVITSPKDDTVTLEAKAKTFRYLDDEELENQRRLVAEAAKKNKKDKRAAKAEK